MPSLVCPQCGNAFDVSNKDFNRGRKFCGHSCASRFHKPERFITAQVRQTIADKRRGSGKADWYIKQNGRHIHRTVAEQKLGRALLPGEIVHHRNENKKDNDPNNLSVFPSQAEHARLHATGKKRKAKTVCKFGHSLTDDNVMITWQGRRRCLTCERKYQREWKRRHKSGVSS